MLFGGANSSNAMMRRPAMYLEDYEMRNDGDGDVYGGDDGDGVGVGGGGSCSDDDLYDSISEGGGSQGEHTGTGVVVGTGRAHSVCSTDVDDTQEPMFDIDDPLVKDSVVPIHEYMGQVFVGYEEEEEEEEKEEEDEEDEYEEEDEYGEDDDIYR